MKTKLTFALILTALCSGPATALPSPKCPSYHACMNMGEARIDVNPRAAIEYFRQALGTHPRDVEAFAYIQMLEPVLYPQPGTCSSFKSCMDLGYTAARDRNYRAALAHFKRALTIEPGNQWAREAIVSVSQAIQGDI